MFWESPAMMFAEGLRRPREKDTVYPQPVWRGHERNIKLPILGQLGAYQKRLQVPPGLRRQGFVKISGSCWGVVTCTVIWDLWGKFLFCLTLVTYVLHLHHIKSSICRQPDFMWLLQLQLRPLIPQNGIHYGAPYMCPPLAQPSHGVWVGSGGQVLGCFLWFGLFVWGFWLVGLGLFLLGFLFVCFT